MELPSIYLEIFRICIPLAVAAVEPNKIFILFLQFELMLLQLREQNHFQHRRRLHRRQVIFHWQVAMTMQSAQTWDCLGCAVQQEPGSRYCAAIINKSIMMTRFVVREIQTKALTLPWIWPLVFGVYAFFSYNKIPFYTTSRLTTGTP